MIINKLTNHIRNQYGQAALVMVLVVMMVMLVIIASVGLLTYNDIKTIGSVADSSQSYYTAEAGIEDALFRIVTKKSYSNNYSLNVGSGLTQVAVSGPLTALVVTSKGNVNNRFRKLSVNLSVTPTSNRISFNYGVQVGYGGLQMLNNTTINGNVYSDGNITGGNTASNISGDAFAANSPALTADQDNISPNTNSIDFGRTNATEDLAQSFKLSTTGGINKVRLNLKRTASAPSNATVRITTDSSGSPGTTLASGTLTATSVGTSFASIDVSMSSNPQLTAGVTYWVVIDGSSNNSKYYTSGANNTYSNGQAKIGQFGGSWGNTTPAGLDINFAVFLGGVNATINSVNIGTSGTGNAHGHNVTNSNISGTNYCQSGSGNNKACDTSQADPTVKDLPVTAGNITDWKAQATAGGQIVGDYTPAGTSSTLGPKEITGNLIVPIGHTLTLTGTVWVHGNITSGSGANFTLDPSYANEGGVLLADGSIDLGNNNLFSGSGQAGSFFMLLTTSDCDGTYSPTGGTCTATSSALDVSNNVGSVVLYAVNGQIHLKNGAAAKEITGWRLKLDNLASVNYDTGLADIGFSSGPGGGYEINSWKEIE